MIALRTENLDVDHSHPIDRAAEWVMAGLLGFSALAFGATEAWSQEIFLGAAILLGLLCLAVVWIRPDRGFAWSIAYVPVGLFLLLVAAQLLRLPVSLLNHIAPGTMKFRSELLGDAPSAPGAGAQTISLYLAPTRQQLRLLLAVSLIFVVAMNLYRDRRAISRALAAITVIGLAVCGVALYQNLTGDTTIYGVAPAGHPYSGPFANHGHYAQFMNLATGAALAYVLARMARLRKLHGSMSDAFSEAMQSDNAPLWLAGALCILGPATVLLSVSRMGVVSLLIATAVISAMLAWKHRSGDAAAVVMGVAVVVLALMLALGFEKVGDRLATLRHVQTADEGRTTILRDMVAEFHRFPALGTGLGTHQYVFPMFDTTGSPMISSYAENDYAQLMEECGAVGIALAVVFLLWAAFNFIRATWNIEHSIQYAAYGVGLGLLAILIHSASDFGQHVPAIAALTAALIAILFNLARSGRIAPTEARHGGVGGRLAGSAALLALLAPLGAWAMGPADVARRGEELWQAASVQRGYLENKGWKGSGLEYRDLLQPMTQAAQLEPDNIAFQYWLNNFRWHALLQQVPVENGTLAWNDVTVGYARRIAAELEAARPLCPSYGPLVCVLGQIECFALDEVEQGTGHIDLAYRLTPYDQNICYVRGALAVERSDWATASDSFARCLGLGGAPSDVIDVYLSAGQSERAYAVAAGDRAALNYLAGALAGDPAEAALAKRCHDQAFAMLLEEVKSAAPPRGALAELAAAYIGQGDLNDGVAWYRKALEEDYSQVGWRIEMARAMAKLGQYHDAVREARVVLTMHPEMKDVNGLIEEWMIHDDSDGRSGPGAH